MRILIASENFYPAVSGITISTERLAVKLAERGHYIVVLAPSLTRSLHIEKRKGYILYRIPSWPNPFRKGLRFTINPGPHIVKIFAEEKPDLVHISIMAGLAFTCMRIARKVNIPVVNTNHFNLEWLLIYLPFLRLIHPFVTWALRMELIHFYNQSAVLTVPTETSKQNLPLKSLTVPIQVISNGVDIDRFSETPNLSELESRYQFRQGVPIILVVGRLGVDKNLSILIEACALLAETHDFQLVFAGSGEAQLDLELEARDSGISEKVTWIPGIDNASTLLNQLYHMGDVFCIPCPMETESMVTMEAMASGLPVVAANSGALPELIKDGVNGYLADPHNARDWVQPLSLLLENADLRKKMGEAGHDMIAARDLGYTVDSFEKLYKKLLHLS